MNLLKVPWIEFALQGIIRQPVTMGFQQNTYLPKAGERLDSVHILTQLPLITFLILRLRSQIVDFNTGNTVYVYKTS